MRSRLRAGIVAITIMAPLGIAGCAELINATSTWPETTSPGEKALRGPLPTAPPVSTPSPPAEKPSVPPVAEIIRGSGRFVGTPKAEGETTSEGDITLNFADADIREVVRVVLGDILKRNYVVDPAVQGTVNIQTSRPMAAKDLLPTLETLLELNGAALVEEGAMYKVVPIAQAPRSTTLHGVRSLLPQQRGYGIQIVPLRHVSASEMSKVLEPIVQEGNILYVDTARNLLLLGGTHQALESILDMVALFDVDWLEGMSFGFFPILNAQATDVAEELQKILTEGDEAPLADLLRFVPIERLNALIVISPRDEYIDKASQWIKRLDNASDQESPRLFVYYVQNKRAADLAQTLSQIFGGGTGTPETAADRLRPGLQPVRIESAGEGAAGQTPKIGTQSTALSTTQQTAGAQPSTGARSLSGMRSRLGSQRRQTGTASSTPAVTQATLQVSGGTTTRVIADESNNALIILATPADYRMLETTIKKLDLVPLQVLLEATIAEVRLTDDLRYGLQWFFDSGKNRATLSQATDGSVASLFPGFSYVFASNDVRVVLNALDSITDVNVISSPSLLVLDNETAVLQVGDEVPIKTRTLTSDTLSTTRDISLSNEIELRDTGVILTVTPRVNSGGLVTLEIEQEISDPVVTTTSDIDTPTIRQRRIQTSVAVQSGETVALGGLIRESRDRGNGGIPILHEIPIIGSLFGATSDTKERTELLVVITPRVVRGREDARQMTEDLRRRLRSVSPLDRKIQ